MSDALVTISGNITADPELRFTQNGHPVASFSVAHTPRRFDRTANEWIDAGETLFLRVNVWREQARNLVASLHKGDAVLVIGSLIARTWQTKDGDDRVSIECTADIVSVDLRRARIEGLQRVRRDIEAPDDAWATSDVPAATSAA